jgi:hypothetical protein
VLKVKLFIYVPIVVFLLISNISAQKKCMFLGATPGRENSQYDQYIMPKLKEWGYEIDKKHNSTDLINYTDKDYEPYDFIFLSETVHSSLMGPLRKVRKPMFCSDGWGAKKTSLGFNDTDKGVGIYEPAKPIVILESGKDHPLSAGYSPGDVVEFGAPLEKGGCLLVWGQPTIKVIPIAGVQGNLDRLAVYGIEKGTKNTFGEVINHRVAVVGAHAWCYPNSIIKEPTIKLMQAGIKWILDSPTKTSENHIKPVNSLYLGLSHSKLNSLHRVTFSIPRQSEIKLTIWNISGQQIQQVVNGVRTAGEHTVCLDASEIPSGVYFLNLDAGNTSYSKRIQFTN